MKAFKCDRCGEFGPAAEKESLRGEQIVKEAFRISLPDRQMSKSGGISYQAHRYINKVDLCAACAGSLKEVLVAWWTPRETMVEFESVEGLVEGFGE